MKAPIENKDKTVSKRVANYAARQSEKGLKLVRVWVPSEAEEDLKSYALNLREGDVDIVRLLQNIGDHPKTDSFYFTMTSKLGTMTYEQGINLNNIDKLIDDLKSYKRVLSDEED